jgi:hypothetical protein
MKPSIQALSLACGSALLSSSLPASAECFSMYDAKNALVYQSPTSPIDLSRPISQEMALHYPSRALVIATSMSCAEGQTTSRYIGAEESGALYGSATSAGSPATAGAPVDATPRVVRRARR